MQKVGTKVHISIDGGHLQLCGGCTCTNKGAISVSFLNKNPKPNCVECLAVMADLQALHKTKTKKKKK